ncbi:MAG: hypothetical protein HY062_06740 [Bacteroidetes bacterium]|nr:hypothetical protein [Bacteroidota bacterium]
MLAFIPSFLFTENDIRERFGDKYNSIINLMTFDKAKYNEQELRFHLLTRSPFIKIMDGYLISPELILDSLITNIHYSLLESFVVKEDYKARQATFFIDKLAEIARKPRIMLYY